VALLLLLPPIPVSISSDLVLEPGTEAHVRATSAGVVSQVFVHPGDRVKEGAVLAVLQNSEIEADARVAAQELALANSELRGYQGRSELEKAAHVEHERARLRQELAVAERRLEGLTVRAPFSGTVTTPQIEQRVGEFLAAGDEFCRLADRTIIKARILVRDWELQEIRAGVPAQAKVTPFPYRTYAGHVEQIMPAASLDRPVAQAQKLERLGQSLTNYFAVTMTFPNPDGSLTEGMTGTARISTGNSPLAWRMGRGAWRWVRSYLWW
jgi:membrane fusion protein, multidrug efflux system